MVSCEKGELTFGLAACQYCQPCQQVAAQRSLYPWPCEAKGQLSARLGALLPWTPDTVAKRGPRPAHPGPIRARPGVLTGVGRPSGLCSWANPEARGLWTAKLKYQVANKLEQRAPKVRFPARGGGEMERSAIKAANPDASFCFNEGRGDSQPGVQGPGAKPNRGMTSVGRGSED